MENNMTGTEHSRSVPQLRFPEFEGEWVEKKLGEIATFSKGKGISKSDIDKDGATECIRYGELYTIYSEVITEIISKTNINEKQLVLSEEDDVIIPASGETQIDIATASCVSKSGVALGGDLNIIKSEIDGIFLSYYLNNARKRNIARLAQGISVVHLYASQLASLTVNIPTPPEQTKIATFLTAVDKRINLLQKKRDHLTQYKKGVMQKLFSQELRFKQDDGSDFPDWEEKKLGDLGKVITGKTPKTNNKELWNGSIQFITPTDITDDCKFQIDTARTVTNNDKLKVLPKHSIVYTCIASIGKMAITVNPAITNQQINSLVLNKVYNYEFVYYALLYITPKIKSTQANTTLPIINKTEFSKFKIKVPHKEEQQKIANFLSSIDKSIEKVEKQIEASQLWKKGLLQKMFV